MLVRLAPLPATAPVALITEQRPDQGPLQILCLREGLLSRRMVSVINCVLREAEPRRARDGRWNGGPRG